MKGLGAPERCSWHSLGFSFVQVSLGRLRVAALQIHYGCIYPVLRKLIEVSFYESERLLIYYHSLVGLDRSKVL